jgi:hypothetical protein
MDRPGHPSHSQSSLGMNGQVQANDANFAAVNKSRA